MDFIGLRRVKGPAVRVKGAKFMWFGVQSSGFKVEFRI